MHWQCLYSAVIKVALWLMLTLDAALHCTHTDCRTLNDRKRGDYQAFLDEANKGAAMFRDIIIEAQYDPLAVNRRAIKARVGKLKDPTSRPVDRYMLTTVVLGV
jgi:hypothetical protein